MHGVEPCFAVIGHPKRTQLLQVMENASGKDHQELLESITFIPRLHVTNLQVFRSSKVGCFEHFK
jgi:hypothetical protein